MSVFNSRFSRHDEYDEEEEEEEEESDITTSSEDEDEVQLYTEEKEEDDEDEDEEKQTEDTSSSIKRSGSQRRRATILSAVGSQSSGLMYDKSSAMSRSGTFIISPGSMSSLKAEVKLHKSKDVKKEKKKNNVWISNTFKKLYSVACGKCLPTLHCSSVFHKWILNKSHFFTLYIISLGILCAFFGATMDWIITGFEIEHFFLTTEFITNYWLGYILWVIWPVACIFLSMMFVWWAPCTAGSGIPEMKAVLSGVQLAQYLSFKTLVGKVGSLIFATGSGIMLGKEGPFVHVCSIIAVQLAKLPLFHKIAKDPVLVQMMIAVACGCGLAANFGAPIGGVLFSIEVTASYYAVDNYFWAFATAAISAVFFWFLTTTSAFIPTNFPPPPAWSYVELPIFIALGLVLGVLGAITSSLIKNIVSTKRIILLISHNLIKRVPDKHKKLVKTLKAVEKTVFHDVWWGLSIALVIGVATYPGNADYAGFRGKHALENLFSEERLADTDGDWEESIGGIWFSMFWFFIVRWLGMAFSLTIPVASGLYIPSLTVGAVVGRFLGEILSDLFPQGIRVLPNAWDNASSEIFPGGYAVVGAAAMVGGFTHTLSSAVTVLEITGQLSYMAPSILAVAVAVGTARQFTYSIYEQILIMRELPYMPALRETRKVMKAKKIMLKADTIGIVKEGDSPEDIATLLNETIHQRVYPVVSSTRGRGRIVVGKTTRRWLQIYLLEYATGGYRADGNNNGMTMGETSLSQSVRSFLKKRVLRRDERELTIRKWNHGGEGPKFRIDWPEVLVNTETKLHVVHLIFVMLQLTEIIVTDSKGRVKGLITRQQVSQLGGRINASDRLSHCIGNCVNGVIGGYDKINEKRKKKKEKKENIKMKI